MMAKAPELLRKRLNVKEKETEQKTVVALSGLLFVAAFIVAGLNWRFGWYVLPDWAVWIASGIFLASYCCMLRWCVRMPSFRGPSRSRKDRRSDTCSSLSYGNGSYLLNLMQHQLSIESWLT